MRPRCHATLTQPLQCVLQHHVANLHVSIRTWQHQRTTIMQPFQCDLQPQIQEAHSYAHRNNHSLQNTKREPIASGTTAAAPAAHRRYLSSPPCSHFTRKNTRFLAPASSPKHGPCNIHAAIPLRSAATASRNAKNYAHRNNHSLQNT